MIGVLPESLIIGGKEYAIATDYRDIMVIMEAYNDPELTHEEAVIVTLKFLYDDFDTIPVKDRQEAAEKAIWFLDCGQEADDKKSTKKLIDWEQDQSILFPAINKVAGKEIRSVEYLHWWTFMGYFMEIGGDGLFSQVLAIRQKVAKGKKLEKWEREFHRNNKAICDIKTRYTQEEQDEMDYLNKLLG